MYRFRVEWLNKSGRICSTDSESTYSNYDSAYADAVAFAKVAKVEIGKISILLGERVIDEISIIL